MVTYTVRTLGGKIAMTSTKRRSAVRGSRLNIRATAHQERLIRTGAATTGVSVTEFIVQSACMQAEHVLLDKKQFAVSSKQWQAFVDALDRPAKVIPELANLFSQSSRRKPSSPQ
jgi:uncharacterized protein (DUF1778 family)